jgi:glycosyltransferase involved in cell wall biosynthesis
MRILLVTPFYAPAWVTGGTSRATAGLAQGLARRGDEVVVATTRWEKADPPEEQAGTLRVLRFEGPRWLRDRLFPWPRGLSRWLGAHVAGFDVAHLAGHRNGLACVAGRALVQARVPYVVQPHGTYPHHGRWSLAKSLVDRLFGARLLRNAGALMAVSRAEAADLPRPAEVIPNGVEAVGVATRPARATICELLFVGSDAPQKRGETLPELLRLLPETRLTLLGRYGERFRARFASFGARVDFRGVLAGNALAAAYAKADLLVQPAVGEAFGLAAFEAALCGTAAVVLGDHGSGEWYRAAGGCVVDAGADDGFLDAVRERLARPELARREAAAVAAFARRELTWSRAAERVEDVYRRVLAALAAARV